MKLKETAKFCEMIKFVIVNNLPRGTNQDQRPSKKASIPQLFSEAVMHILESKQWFCTEQREYLSNFRGGGQRTESLLV